MNTRFRTLLLLAMLILGAGAWAQQVGKVDDKWGVSLVITRSGDLYVFAIVSKDNPVQVQLTRQQIASLKKDVDKARGMAVADPTPFPAYEAFKGRASVKFFRQGCAVIQVSQEANSNEYLVDPKNYSAVAALLRKASH